MRAATCVPRVRVGLLAAVDCRVVCRTLGSCVDCAGVSDQNCSLCYMVVRVVGASIHGVLEVQAMACRVSFNQLVAHDGGGD